MRCDRSDLAAHHFSICLSALYDIACHVCLLQTERSNLRKQWKRGQLAFISGFACVYRKTLVIAANFGGGGVRRLRDSQTKNIAFCYILRHETNAHCLPCCVWERLLLLVDAIQYLT